MKVKQLIVTQEFVESVISRLSKTTRAAELTGDIYISHCLAVDIINCIEWLNDMLNEAVNSINDTDIHSIDITDSIFDTKYVLS